jgi:hypothetical protein
MTIKSTGNLLHWNYFLAIESDLEDVSRYIEFHEDNYKTYSIELAHLLLAASSEADVIAKQICNLVDAEKNADNIVQYREVIIYAFPSFSEERIYIPRYGLDSQPWINFKSDNSPDWWRDYNKVKHERNEHFGKANLKNAINSVGGLLTLIFYFYLLELGKSDLKEVGFELLPESRFVRLDEKYHPTRAFLLGSPVEKLR